MTSVVTNLVVAVMIVSNGYERVNAIKYDGLIVDPNLGMYSCVMGTPEPMLRERSYTNFVYASGMCLDWVVWRCLCCKEERVGISPSDAIGTYVGYIRFNGVKKCCRKCCESFMLPLNKDPLESMKGGSK